MLHDLNACSLYRGRLFKRHVPDGKAGKADLCSSDWNLRISCFFWQLFDDTVRAAGILVRDTYVCRTFVLPGKFSKVPLCSKAESVDPDDSGDGLCKRAHAVWNVKGG